MEEKVAINPTPPQENLTQLSSDLNIPKLFVNGFQCQLSLTDVSIILKQNNANIGLIMMTHSAIKSLHQQLGLLMQQYESLTGTGIYSFEELTDLVNKKYNDDSARK